MNLSTHIRRAMETARLARRSHKGANSPKGFGKKMAHKADRRVGRALSREEA